MVTAACLNDSNTVCSDEGMLTNAQSPVCLGRLYAGSLDGTMSRSARVAGGVVTMLQEAVSAISARHSAIRGVGILISSISVGSRVGGRVGELKLKWAVQGALGRRRERVGACPRGLLLHCGRLPRSESDGVDGV